MKITKLVLGLLVLGFFGNPAYLFSQSNLGMTCVMGQQSSTSTAATGNEKEAGYFFDISELLTLTPTVCAVIAGIVVGGIYIVRRNIWASLTSLVIRPQAELAELQNRLALFNTNVFAIRSFAGHEKELHVLIEQKYQDSPGAVACAYCAIVEDRLVITEIIKTLCLLQTKMKNDVVFVPACDELVSVAGRLLSNLAMNAEVLQIIFKK